MSTYWESRGEVRGGCGHRHRTEDAARRCGEADNRAIKRYYGSNAYSDRYPTLVEERPS